jgi:hypothetical protein
VSAVPGEILLEKVRLQVSQESRGFERARLKGAPFKAFFFQDLLFQDVFVQALSRSGLLYSIFTPSTPPSSW